MAEIRIRQSRLPLVDVFYPETVTVEDLDAAFARYAEISRRGVPFGYLIDMRNFDPSCGPPTARKHASTLFSQYFSRLKRVTVCEGRIVSSARAKGILTAFDWLSGPKWPCETFMNAEKAEVWVIARLRERGLEVPDVAPTLQASAELRP